MVYHSLPSHFYSVSVWLSTNKSWLCSWIRMSFWRQQLSSYDVNKSWLCSSPIYIPMWFIHLLKSICVHHFGAYRMKPVLDLENFLTNSNGEKEFKREGNSSSVRTNHRILHLQYSDLLIDFSTPYNLGQYFDVSPIRVPLQRFKPLVVFEFW